jgi:major membrane immunogen (membrane-anchored lipoprotein)
MIRRTELGRCPIIVVAFCLAMSLGGCGSDDGLGKRYSVYGTVSYNGQPVEKGEIAFVPEDPGGRAASGVIENGSYTLSTIGNRDGALPGKYKVTVTAREVDVAKAEALFKEKAKKGKDVQTSIIPKEFMTKAAKSAKNNVPVKYSAPDTSKLTAEVKEQSNSIPFELTD